MRSCHRKSSSKKLKMNTAIPNRTLTEGKIRKLWIVPWILNNHMLILSNIQEISNSFQSCSSSSKTLRLTMIRLIWRDTNKTTHHLLDSKKALNSLTASKSTSSKLKECNNSRTNCLGAHSFSRVTWTTKLTTSWICWTVYKRTRILSSHLSLLNIRLSLKKFMCLNN